ncbi:MAG: hypothetical protein M3Q44_03785 [bacterium]|nr:hypothetical protein [bacterium]
MSDLLNVKVTFIVTTQLPEKARDLIQICAFFGEYTADSNFNYSQNMLVNRWTREVVSDEKFTQEYQFLTINKEIIKLPVSRYNQAQTLCSESIIRQVLSSVESIREQHPFVKQIILGFSIENTLQVIEMQNDIASIRHFSRNLNSPKVVFKGHSSGSGVAVGYLKRINKKSDLHRIHRNAILVGPYSLLKDATGLSITALILTDKVPVKGQLQTKFKGPKLYITEKQTENIPDGAYISLNIHKSELTLIGRSVKSKLATKVESGKLKFYSDISAATTINTGAYGYSFLNGMELVKSVLQKHKEGTYTDAFTAYVINELKLSPLKPIIYQSICVASGKKLFLGKQGAQFIQENPDFFIEELEALHRLLHIYNFRDITLTIPFIRTVKEFESIKQIITKSKLTRSPRFKLFITVQIPANVLQLEEYLDIGVDGVILDIQCLTDLTMGIDSHLFNKAYKKAAHTYEFMDEGFRFLQGPGVCEASNFISKETRIDPSIKKMLEHCNEIAKKRHIPLFIYFACDYEEEQELDIKKQVLLYSQSESQSRTSFHL